MEVGNVNKTIEVAQYLIYAYERFANSRFETQELKLQKLMYFAQRESFFKMILKDGYTDRF